MSLTNIYPKAYGAYSKDEKNILNSSSGGIFFEIVKWFESNYPNDFFICGAVWDDDFKGVHHVLSSLSKDIDRMRISKYVQSKKGTIFAEIKTKLENGKFILFTGCPCEVAGLKSYLGKEFDNLFTVDFMCKGSLSPSVMKEYIELVERRNKSKVAGINMRYKWKKLDIWIPQFIRLDFESGKYIVKEFYNTEIGHAFRIMQRPACYSCPFTEKNKVSDFTMGDFHGAKETMAFFNPRGISTIFVNNKRGEEILSGISDAIVFQEADINYIYDHNKGFKDITREEFGLEFEKNGLVSALNKSLCRKDKIKMNLPTKFVRLITSFKRRI